MQMCLQEMPVVVSAVMSCINTGVLETALGWVMSVKKDVVWCAGFFGFFWVSSISPLPFWCFISYMLLQTSLFPETRNYCCRLLRQEFWTVHLEPVRLDFPPHPSVLGFASYKDRCGFSTRGQNADFF